MILDGGAVFNQDRRQVVHQTGREVGGPQGTDVVRGQLRKCHVNARVDQDIEALPAEERQACQKLWADVDALLMKAQPKPAAK